MKISEVKVSESFSPGKKKDEDKDVLCLRCSGVVETKGPYDGVKYWCTCVESERERLKYDPTKHFGGRDG